MFEENCNEKYWKKYKKIENGISIDLLHFSVKIPINKVVHDQGDQLFYNIALLFDCTCLDSPL